MNIFKLVKELKKVKKKIFISIHQDIFLSGFDLYNILINLNILLKKEKFKANDKVAILYENSIEYIILSFFIFLKNCTLVPINPNLKINEINSILQISGAKIIFSPKKNKLFISKNIVFNYSNELLKSKNQFVFKKKKQSYLLLLFTSGSTGIPKGALISEKNLFHHSQTLSFHHKINKKTNTLVLMPMFHNNGFVISFMSTLIHFGTIYLCPAELALSKFFKIINFYKINFTSLMPAVLSMILYKSKPMRTKHKLLIACGGQKLAKNLARNFEKKTNTLIIEHYGLTETTSVCAINDLNNRNLNSVGKVLRGNVIKILNNKQKLSVEGYGEICVKGPNVIKEYFNNKKLNREKWLNGFFRTGDYGLLSKNRLFFKSRKDFLIIKSGENIYPAEIENVVYNFKFVHECAAIGYPDKLTGENICLFVKLKKNSKVIIRKFENFLVKNIAKFKIPKKVFYLNVNTELKEIPKTDSKKIKYGELKKFIR